MDMYFRANIFLVGLIRYNQTKACVQTSGRVGTSVDGQYLRETEEQSKDATVTLRRGIYMEATDVEKTGPLAACTRASRCFTRVCT